MNNKDAINYFFEQLRSEQKEGFVDFIIPSIITRKIVAYQNMRVDLLSIKESAIILKERDLDAHIKATLWSSTIAMYGRCFTDASESKFPKLETDVFTMQSRLREWHEKIMTLRHNFVAHRGENNHEYSISYMRVCVNTLDKEVIVNHLRQNKPDDEYLDAIIELANYLVPVVENKYGKAATKVVKSMFDNFSYEEMLTFKVKSKG